MGTNTKASGDYSTAMGAFTEAGGLYSTAISEGASAQLADSVALGSKSVANTTAGVVGYDAKGTDHAADTSGTWKSTRTPSPWLPTMTR